MGYEFEYSGDESGRENHPCFADPLLFLVVFYRKGPALL